MCIRIFCHRHIFQLSHTAKEWHKYSCKIWRSSTNSWQK